MDSLIKTLEQLPTPHLVYSEKYLCSYADFLKEVLPEANFFFAVKSCYSPPVLQILSKMGLGAEVMSEFEYRHALNNGFSPNKVIVNGLGRDKNFLKECINNGSTIIIDSEGDLDNIINLANNQHNSNILLGLRYRPNLEGEESPYAKKRNKLGTNEDSGYLDKLVSFVREKDNVLLDMVHMHITINNRSTKIYQKAIDQLRTFVDNFLDDEVKNVNLGGGFDSFPIGTLDHAHDFFQNIGAIYKSKFPKSTLCLEPGRFLSNPAGFVVATVIDIKKSDDLHHLIIDASTNVLIPIPTAKYELVFPKPVNEGVKVAISDGITSPDNVIIREKKIGEIPRIGDKIIMGCCGAYTDVLSEFWVYAPFQTSLLQKDNSLAPIRSLETIKVCQDLFWA